MKLGALIACSKELVQLDVVGITDNSKKVRDGFVFVDTHNNPQYVADAVKNGAVALVLKNKANFKNEIVLKKASHAILNRYYRIESFFNSAGSFCFTSSCVSS